MPDSDNKSRFYLKQKILDVTPTYSLNEVQFKALSQARTVLQSALAVEEAYDILLSNQLEFEKELLAVSANQMMRMAFTYEALNSERIELARRIANMLTSATSYVDQAPRHFGRCLASADMKAVFCSILSAEYDARFEFRFMEALRNHVQHHSIAIDGMTSGGARDRHSGQTSYIVAPYVTKAVLIQNKKFKREVLNEMPDRVDLREMARGYVSGLSNAHAKFRSETEDRVSDARILYAEAIETYSKLNGGEKTYGLVAICEVDGAEKESFHVLLDWDNVRIWLVSRNGRLGDFENHYVSSELAVRTTPSGPRP